MKCFYKFSFNLSQNFKIVQQQNANADDINEVIYCHRFCEAHQHEHKHDYHPLRIPLDLHSESIILETLECFIIAKEYSSSDLIHDQSIQCNHCSSYLGSFGIYLLFKYLYSFRLLLDPQKNLMSFNKCSILPFSNDYLSSCFQHYESGRYIVKVPKYNDSIFLIWILPNQLISSNLSLDLSNKTTQLEFYPMRKILYAHVTSVDNKTFNDWKRDFSVTTILVNRFCLDHLLTAFQQAIEKFPNTFNSNEIFQSLTICC